MTPTSIIGQLMAALRKIAEHEKPLAATSHMDWRKRASRIASIAVDDATKAILKTHVRYCHECGSIGEVSAKHIDCCPGGSHAVYVPREVAEQARVGFRAQLVEIKDKDITHG
jgi:hypothetical protein